MRVIIDCSVLLAHTLEDESDDYAKHIFTLASQQDIQLIAPPLLLMEACNGLVSNVRRKRISVDDWHNIMLSITQSPIQCSYEVDVLSSGRLAIVYALSVYDATYLACAIKYDAKLATLDHALLAAAKKEKVDFKP